MCGWLSDVTFQWTWDIVVRGKKSDLKEKDVPVLEQSSSTHTAFTTLQRHWERHCHENSDRSAAQPISKQCSGRLKSYDNISDNVPLVKILVNSFGVKYLLLHILLGLITVTDFCHPVFTKHFMLHIKNREIEHWTKGLWIVLSWYTFSVLRAFCRHRLTCESTLYQRFIGSSIMMAIFKKSLMTKGDCTKDTTASTVNLISYECERIGRMGRRIHMFIGIPLTIIVSMAMLYAEVGNSMFIGFLIIVVLAPLNLFVGKRFKMLRLRARELNESRSEIMNEAVNGIQALKLYAWEPWFIRKINEVTKCDEKCNQEFNLVHAFCDSMFKSIPFIVKLFVFSTFLLSGGSIDASNGFTVIRLFHMLNQPFGDIAIMAPGFLEAYLSLQKVNEYLNSANIDVDTVTKMPNTNCNKKSPAISIKNGSFSWNQDKGNNTPRAVIKNINVEIEKGSLVAVVGRFGSGKSSFISAMLGEMRKLSGNVQVQGDIAYVPQDAWILNKTLQENILFGSEYDNDYYDRVINACSLMDDIEKMSDKDLSMIGEKGINLSGGQKQRVSLARAVYSNADVYLLDDPLSAVDVRVGKHIFNNVVGSNGLLNEKTRVLVTHGVQWLPFVDKVIVINDGRISDVGTYDQLIKQSIEFKDFICHAVHDKSIQNEKDGSTIKEKTTTCVNDQIQMEASVGNEEEEKMEASKTRKNVSENDNILLCSNGVKSSTKHSEKDDPVSKEEGKISSTVYFQYARAVGYRFVALCLSIYLAVRLLDFAKMYVFKQWTDSGTYINKFKPYSASNIENNEAWKYFYTYAIFGTVEVIIQFFYVMIILRYTFKAATKLHDQLLHAIFHYPMEFFETTSSAQIIGLFSKDICKIYAIGDVFRYLIGHFLKSLVAFILLVVSCPLIIVFVLPLSLIQYLNFDLHSGTLRQLRRFRSKHKSPVPAHFMETLNGRETIRAFNCQNRFMKNMENNIDKLGQMEDWENSVFTASRARSEIIFRTLQMVTYLVCLYDTTMTAGMVGVISLYAYEFYSNLNEFIRLSAYAQLEMVSLEKVVRYSRLKQEAAWENLDKKSALQSWPNEGQIEFKKYKATYKSNFGIKGIDCCIESGQKIGIVGRTGSGKTTLAMSLFRLLEPCSGSLVVSGEDIAQLGLHDLRSRINILPQDPTIFKGSLRRNIDPSDGFTDEEIWEALEHAHLRSFVENADGCLNFQCGEGGKNLSVGEKQLLCLARVLLKKSKILVLDEATAAVDMKTDRIIQKTIRNEFKQCTVLSIAHRLETIVDYDKVMVLEDGIIREFDSPQNLMTNTKSAFYTMTQESRSLK